MNVHNFISFQTIQNFGGLIVVVFGCVLVLGAIMYVLSEPDALEHVWYKVGEVDE